MSKFKYRAYCNLISELGQIDFAIEMNELSLRYFLKDLSNSADKELFLKKQCNDLGIYVGLNSVEDLRQRMALSYIAFVYHSVESFFILLKDEYNKIQGYGKDDVKRLTYKQGETKLNQLLTRFKAQFNIHDKIEDELIDTFEYYHELRDKFCHPVSDSSKDITKKYIKAVKHKVILSSRFNTTDAPKELEKLDFEDFFLFTKVAKELCRLISAICLPETGNLVIYLKLNRFKKYKDNPERVKKAISLELLKTFGCDTKDSVTFVEEIYEHLV